MEQTFLGKGMQPFSVCIKVYQKWSRSFHWKLQLDYKQKFKIKKLFISTWSKRDWTWLQLYSPGEKKIMPENCLEKCTVVRTEITHSAFPRTTPTANGILGSDCLAYLPYCFISCTVIFLIIHIRKIPGTWQPLQDFSFLHSHLGQKTLHPFRSKSKHREAIKQSINISLDNQVLGTMCWTRRVGFQRVKPEAAILFRVAMLCQDFPIQKMSLLLVQNP